MSRQTREIRKTSAGAGSEASRTTINPDYDAIGALAYELWLKRGCPIGSPEEDWFQAERLLARRNQSTSTAA
jgi:DUF2934 family protein